MQTRRTRNRGAYGRKVKEAEDFVGYSLVAVTVAAGVVLAVVFSAI